MVVVRDRTAELQEIFDRVRVNDPKGVHSAIRPPTAHATPQASQFYQAAQEFSKQIAGTSDRIASLTKLIQQQNVFDDNAGDIASLTTIVKSNLASLHDDLGALASMKDEAARSTAGQGSRHSETVLNTLRSRLVHTSQNFKSVLQNRTKSIKDTCSRRNQFSYENPTSFESALFSQNDDMGGGAQSQDMQLQTRNVNYFRQRQEAVRQLEFAVREVGEMFQDFTRIVHEQEELVIRIDTDLEDTERNIEAGSGELVKYLKYLSSNRGLIMRIFAVLFVFILFFGFFIVK